MIRTCDGCGRDLDTGATLCDQCVRTLDVALANIAVYHADLDIVEARQTSYGSTRAGKAPVGKVAPLPIDGRFADPAAPGSALRWEARNTIATWARVCLDEWPPLAGPTCSACLHRSCHDARRRRCPRDTVTACCEYLAGHRYGIAGQAWAGQLLDELLDVERRLERFVDRPRDAWYAGLCGACARPLYAEPGDPWVRCGDCGCEYDTEGRRKALLVEAEDREATVRTLARGVAMLVDGQADEVRLEARISKWVARGRLTPAGVRVVDGKPRRTYRIGDVLDLLTTRREGAERG